MRGPANRSGIVLVVVTAMSTIMIFMSAMLVMRVMADNGTTIATQRHAQAYVMMQAAKIYLMGGIKNSTTPFLLTGGDVNFSPVVDYPNFGRMGWFHITGTASGSGATVQVIACGGGGGAFKNTAQIYTDAPTSQGTYAPANPSDQQYRAAQGLEVRHWYTMNVTYVNAPTVGPTAYYFGDNGTTRASFTAVVHNLPTWSQPW